MVHIKEDNNDIQKCSVHSLLMGGGDVRGRLIVNNFKAICKQKCLLTEEGNNKFVEFNHLLATSMNITISPF